MTFGAHPHPSASRTPYPAHAGEGRFRWRESGVEHEMEAVAGGEDFGVGDAKDAPAGAVEECGAFGVEGLLFGGVVRRAVDFDDEARADAGEVDDVRADGVLAAEFSFAVAAAAQEAPEFGFRAGGIGAVAPGLLDGARVAHEVSLVVLPCEGEKGGAIGGASVRATRACWTHPHPSASRTPSPAHAGEGRKTVDKSC